jgi:mannose-6-phosphate isomerase class I
VTYDPEPRYPLSVGEVEPGVEPLVAECRRRGARVVALDGPPAAPWDELVGPLVATLGATTVDTREHFAPWDEIRRRTAESELDGDPVFGRLSTRRLRELVDELPSVAGGTGIVLVHGPGASFVPHDLLVYVDVPKRASLDAVRRGAIRNLGQPAGAVGTEQRLLFVDWPILDRHKQALGPSLDRYVDASDPARLRSVSGDALRATLHALACRPFRTRPAFLPGPWGGQWLRRRLGIATDAPNLAWSYELITPESGILLGDAEPVEVAFELLMALRSEFVLGASVAERFGVSFPIRFDYLDTLEGGHLSLQCHPRAGYARETFGLAYTQDETYYVMETTPGARVFLGLRDEADLAAFRVAAERADDGVELDADRFLASHPAEQHRLYLIPAGTPHASGAGNVVLEISATPYLYTLRFYDWLRRDLDGALRPVHVARAFANVDGCRRGDALRELMAEPFVVRQDNRCVELELGRHPDLFFAVHRLDFADTAEDDTAGRFHVLNLVAGEEVEIVTQRGDVHALSYAETIVVPAAVGGYAIHRVRGPECKVVKAFVA